MPASKVLAPERQRTELIPFPAQMTLRSAFAIWIERIVFASICALAYVTLHDASRARLIFWLIIPLWILQLLLSGKQVERHPLARPLVCFLLLAAIATVFSYAPLLSWQRLGWWTLMLLALIVPSSLKTLRRVQIVVLLLSLSAAVSTLRTGWQYILGIGTELMTVPADTLLYRDGLRSGDLVQLLNGHKTRSPQQWKTALEKTRADQRLRLHVARGAPITYHDFSIARGDLEEYLRTPNAAIRRGRPERAQGHLYHYMPYAGELLEVGLLLSGLLVMVPKNRRGTRVSLAVLFAGVAAALAATLTRIYLGAMMLGCTFQVWLAHKRYRFAALVALLLALAAATLFIEKERGFGWLAPSDLGTEYRLSMWKESVQLIKSHPLLGIGPDSVLQYGERWNVPAYKEFSVVSHFHSTYIEVAVDCGLPCLAAWLWLMGAYLVWLWRQWKEAGSWPWFSRGVLLGVWAAVIGFVLAGFVQYNLGDGEVMMLFWLFMGMVVALARIQENSAVS